MKLTPPPVNVVAIASLVLASGLLAQDASRAPSSKSEQSPVATGDPATKMRGIIVGERIAMMVAVAAELGVADLLRDGPKGVEELASATKTHGPSLYRILRALASHEIFSEDDDGRFRLTPTAELLRSDVPGSVRESARSLTRELSRGASANMLNTVRTGKSAVEHAFGMSLFEYLAKHPAQEEAFNRQMAEGSRRIASQVVTAYDFSRTVKVVDIAGGQGILLSHILKAHPHPTAVLFELPSVVEEAKRTLDPAVLARAELTSGDFFKSVPQGGDVYILKDILHDWDDDRAVVILKNIRRAMSGSAKLLVIEGVVPKGNSPSLAKMMDVTMLMFTGGRERTETEHRNLLRAGGFRLNRLIPVRNGPFILEAVPE